MLRGMLDNARSSRGGLILLSGEPGIGKTRLIEHFAEQVSPRTAKVLWGRCHADPDVPAYWPWKQVISRYADGRDDAGLRVDLGDAARDIVPLVPKLAARFPEFSRLSSHEPPETRQRLFEGVVEFVKNAARSSALVIALDDLQWADNASLTLLDLLAMECRQTAILLIAACRFLDFPKQSHASMASLARHGSPIALSGLSLTEIGKVIRAISGRIAPDRLVRAFHETTQGNPLFVEQLTRFVTTHRAWDIHDPKSLGLPQEMVLAIRNQLAPFSARTRETLATAAVVGRTAPIDVLARATSSTIEELLASMTEAMAARVLEETPGSPREYSFTHILIREVLYDDLPPLEKAEIHARVARAILELHGHDLQDRVFSVAHHFYQATRVSNPELAVGYCARAGEVAASQFAYEEAVSQFRRALIASELTAHDPLERCRLLLQLGDAQRCAGDVEQSRATFLEAIALARGASSDELLARGALGYAGFWHASLGIVDERNLELLNEAAERLKGSHPALRARILARVVHEAWWARTREHSQELLDEALTLSEQSGDPGALAHVLHIRHLALWNHHDLDERLRTALTIVNLRGRISQELVLEGYSWLIADELERGNAVECEAARLAHERLAQEIRQPNHIELAHIRRAARHVFQGSFAEARAICEQRSVTPAGEALMLQWSFVQFAICRERDTLHEIEPMVRALAAAASSWPTMRYWAAYVAAAAGCEDARIQFEGIAADRFTNVPTDLTHLIALCASAEACALVGSVEHARILYERLLPFAGRQIQFGNAITYHDSVTHALAQLATQLEEWDTANEHFSEALRQAQALGAAPRTAHIEFRWAAMLFQRAHPASITRARALLDKAGRSARHLDLGGLIPKIEALQHELPSVEAPTSSDERAPIADQPAIVHSQTTKSHRPSAPVAHAAHVFRCEGEFWTLQFEQETIRLKDTRGLQFIATLLRTPRTLIHALELASSAEGRVFKGSSAGNFIDPKARNAYRERLHELASEQAAAEAQNDPPRAERARQESELLMQQLAKALGIGGRNRRAAAEAERARINVTRSIRSAISRMTLRSPALAHHLSTSIRTGTFCQYVPDPSRRIEWEL
jgi:hypothetical protein